MKKELEEIQAFLEQPISDDMDEAIERGNKLSSYIARTGKLYADAKNNLNVKMNSEIMETLRKIARDTPMATSTTINKLVNSLCAEEQYLVDLAERLNKSATHSLDWLRSIVSKAKQDRYYTSGINQR